MSGQIHNPAFSTGFNRPYSGVENAHGGMSDKLFASKETINSSLTKN